VGPFLRARTVPALSEYGEGRCAADAGFVCASRRPQQRADGQLPAGLLWPANARCNGAPLSETKIKGDLASRFSVRRARSSSPSSRRLTPCHDLPRIKTIPIITDQIIKSEHGGTDRRRKTELAYPVGGQSSSLSIGDGWSTEKRRPQGTIKPISHANQAAGKAFRSCSWHLPHTLISRDRKRPEETMTLTQKISPVIHRRSASYNDRALLILCPITRHPCEGDLAYLCEDYGCARKGGLSPHSDENL
jgi:hypothetical protein